MLLGRSAFGACHRDVVLAEDGSDETVVRRARVDAFLEDDNATLFFVGDSFAVQLPADVDVAGTGVHLAEQCHGRRGMSGVPVTGGIASNIDRSDV